MKKSRLSIFLWAIAISIFAGINPVFAKIGLEVFDPFTLVFLRFFCALVFFIPFLHISRSSIEEVKKHSGKLALLGFVSALNPILLFIALQFTQASVSPFIYAIVPGLTALWLFFIQKRELSSTTWLGIVLGIIGVGTIVLLPIISDASEEVSLLGNLLILSAAVAFMIFGLLSKKVQSETDFSPQALTVTFIIVSLILSTPFALWEIFSPASTFEISTILLRHIISVLIIGILGTSVFYLLYQKVIEKDTAMSASLFTFIQPVVTPLTAFFLIGEKITITFILGGIVATLGAWLASKR